MKAATYAPRGALALNPKMWGGEFLVFTSESAPKDFEEVGPYAVVSVSGPLEAKAHWCWDNYEAITLRCQSAFASGKPVILKLDSPGGAVAGLFDCARGLRAMAREAGVPFIAYVDGMAASAAYALATSCDAIYASETAFVGSIGVIEAMVDVTGADAAMGIRWAFVTSGERKADGNPHAGISEGALGAMQGQVDGLAMLFYQLVEVQRGIPVDTVKSLQAGMFFGENAIASKLIDRTITFAALVAGEVEKETEEPMASKKMSDAVAALMAMADGDDEKEASRAKRMLKMISEGDESDGDEKPKDKEASASDEKEEPAAKAEDEKEKPEASAKANPILALAQELHGLKAQIAARDAADIDAKARAAIFAKRPDIGETVRAALASTPTKGLEKVLEAFPVIAHPAAAAQVGGTLGEGQAVAANLTTADSSFIDEKMLGTAPSAVVGTVGNNLMLGMISQEDARKRVAALNGGGSK